MYEPVEVHRVSSDYSEVCSRFVKIRFDCSKAYCQLAEVRYVGFVCSKACIRLVGIHRICFDLPQNVFESSRCVYKAYTGSWSAFCLPQRVREACRGSWSPFLLQQSLLEAGRGSWSPFCQPKCVHEACRGS